MNADKLTTVAGTVTVGSMGIAGGMFALPQVGPDMGIDPALLALIPPPYNMYAALAFLAIGFISHIVQSVMTNKPVVQVSSDSQMSTPGKVVPMVLLCGTFVMAGCGKSLDQTVKAAQEVVKIAPMIYQDIVEDAQTVQKAVMPEPEKAK